MLLKEIDLFKDTKIIFSVYVPTIIVYNNATLKFQEYFHIVKFCETQTVLITYIPKFNLPTYVKNRELS